MVDPDSVMVVVQSPDQQRNPQFVSWPRCFSKHAEQPMKSHQHYAFVTCIYPSNTSRLQPTHLTSTMDDLVFFFCSSMQWTVEWLWQPQPHTVTTVQIRAQRQHCIVFLLPHPHTKQKVQVVLLIMTEVTVSAPRRNFFWIQNIWHQFKGLILPGTARKEMTRTSDAVGRLPRHLGPEFKS